MMTFVAPAPALRPRSSGFTLVEIMVVVVIIGLLASLAIPAFNRVRLQARVNTFVNDLRIGRDAFHTYATENGRWPPDGNAGMPVEMTTYLKMSNWSGATPLGGNWDWDFEQFGFRAGLSVYQPTVDAATMTVVDAAIDDGNLATGNFRARTDGYILILEF